MKQKAVPVSKKFGGNVLIASYLILITSLY